ncbi:MAG: FAD-dependent oxidoreductase, partial [Planctomycetota bacterium]
MRQYDLVVIGSGPAGQKAAIQAAKLGRKVALVEKNNWLGGVALNTGTIPSKALREAILHLTGASKRGLFGEAYRVKSRITVGDLISVSRTVINHERELVMSQLVRNGVDVVEGHARFDDDHQITVTVSDSDTGKEVRSERIQGDNFVLAIGTQPARPTNVPFSDGRVFTSDGILKLKQLPKSMIVVGGGVIGTEYACMMATLGVKVTLVEGRNKVLGFLDDEICEAFQYQMRRAGITLRLGEKVKGIELIGTDHPDYPQRARRRASDVIVESDDAAPEVKVAEEVEYKPDTPPGNVDRRSGSGDDDHVLVQATLESGKKLRAQTLFYAVGRQGTTSALAVDKAGLEADDRERLRVNEHYQTNVHHIYACGDVIGFPALASTAMEQGRLAACHMFGIEAHSFPDLFPFGIYAIPEISMVGKTEEELTNDGIPYEAGVATYSEIARGQLLGDETGMLKLLIHQDNRDILGVHVIGSGATELIHIGQTAMAMGGKADFFSQN